MWALRMNASGCLSWATPTKPDGGSTSRSGDRIGEPLLGGQAQQWATPNAKGRESTAVPCEKSLAAGGASDLRHDVRGWLTPDCNTASYSNGIRGQNIREAAQAWPTPAARDEKGPNGELHRQTRERAHDGQLPNSVMMWATPNVPSRGPESRASNANRGSGGVDTQTQAQAFPSSLPAETTTDAGLRSLLAVWTPPVCRALSVGFQWWLMGWSSPPRTFCESAAMASFRCKLRRHLQRCLGT